MPKTSNATPRHRRFAEPGRVSARRDHSHTVLDLAMEASHLVWWDWVIATDRLVLHSTGVRALDAGGETPVATGSEWLARVHPEDITLVQESLDACLLGERPRWDCEHRFRSGADGWRWVANHGRVVDRDPLTQQALRLIGTTQDIEDRKRAAETLSRDSALLTHIQDAVFCLDTRLRYTYWNAGAERLLGWTAKDLMGQDFTARFPAEQAGEEEAKLRRVLSGPIFSAEQELGRRDGSRVWVDLQAYPLRDNQDQIVGVMAVARDITERRREHAERLRIEHQLAQSQKMETLGTLAGGIAHDFNNLLAAILGYAEIAGGLLPVGHPALHKLDHVTAAGKRAAELVRRILAFSRSSEQTRIPIDLNQLMAETFSLLRASLPTTIELICRPSPEPAVALADATQLQQILLNCCTNSAHALRGRSDGRIGLTIEAMDLESAASAQAGALRAGAYVRMSINDNGCGMTPEVVAQIFEPFFTTKPTGEGTGLGLAFAQGIVTAHGGAIMVESRPGQGARFDIYLPALSQRASAETVPANSADRPTQGQGECIAVIDDEESIALLAQQALEHKGYRVTAYERARDCLDRLLERPDAFRLVITDQTMPQMTGIELITALRAAGNPVPVLILSGYAPSLAPRALIDLGHVGFLGKPFDLSVLFGEVHRLLNPAK